MKGSTLAFRAMSEPEQCGFDYELRAMRDEEGWRERAREMLQQALAQGMMESEFWDWMPKPACCHCLYFSRHDGKTMLTFCRGPFWFLNSHISDGDEYLVSDEVKLFAQQVFEHAAVARRKIFSQVGANDPTIKSLEFSEGESCYSPGAFRSPTTEGECSSDAQEMCAALRGNTHVRALSLVGWDDSELSKPCELCKADLVLLASVLGHTDVTSVWIGGPAAGPPDLVITKDMITKLCFDNVVRLIRTKSLAQTCDPLVLGYRCVDGPMLHALTAALPSNRHVRRDLALCSLDLKLATSVTATELQGFAATVRQSGLLSVSLERDGSPDHPPWKRCRAKKYHRQDTTGLPPTGFDHAWNDIKQACTMNRKQLVCRRHQRLLLSTVHRNAGAESDGALVQSALFLNGDICELVCKHLDAPECMRYPMDWRGEFAWHENDAAVAMAVQRKRAYEQEFLVYQTHAKRRRIAEIVLARNIELVMSTTNVDRATAVAVVHAHGGDVSSALMSMAERMTLASPLRSRTFSKSIQNIDNVWR